MKDEEDRLKMIAGDLGASDAIKHVHTDVLSLDDSLISEAEQKKIEAANQKDDQVIN